MANHMTKSSPPPEKRHRTARSAITVVLLTALSTTLIASDQALTAAKGIDNPFSQRVLTRLLTPVDYLARGLHLHAPRDAMAAAIGKERTSTSEQDADGLEARAKQVEDRLDELPKAPVRWAPPKHSPSPDTKVNPADRFFYVPQMPASLIDRLRSKRPLRILFTGDSTAYEPGWGMVRSHSDMEIKVADVTGTGLLRPDAFDWSLKARSQVRSFDPDIVFLFMGPNDLYGVDGIGYHDSRWAAKYAARIQVVMETYAEGGRRLVVWAPPAIDALTAPYMGPGDNKSFRMMHQAARLAAQATPGGGQLNMYDLFAVRGGYSDTVRDPITGKLVHNVRFRDGTHLTMRGGRLVARVITSWMMGLGLVGQPPRDRSQ